MNQVNVRISPLARALANKLGYDINLIKGTGFMNKIMEADVKTFDPKLVAQATNFVNNVSVKTGAQTLVAKREKISPVRRAIAKAMKNSWANVAYVNLRHRVDVTNLWNYRNMVKDIVLAEKNIKITFLAFVIKATALALKEFPIFGAKYDEKSDELVYPDDINIGIAVDTDHGLFVPVIKQIANKSVVELAEQIIVLAKAAREKTLKPEQMRNGIFTITNYGSVNALYGVPIINYPDIAILGLGAIVDEAQYSKKDKKLVPAKILYLTVAADHRWIDGSLIGRFTTRVAQLLENPYLLGVY